MQQIIVTIPLQTNQAVLSNPHLSALEKRLGVVLKLNVVKASFNNYFFYGDKLISLNNVELANIDETVLTKKNLKVTLYSGLKNVDKQESLDLEKMKTISSSGKNLYSLNCSTNPSKYHVFSEDKRMVSLQNCANAKPTEYLNRGIYTLTSTIEKMLGNATKSTNIEYLCDYVTEIESNILENRDKHEEEPEITEKQIHTKSINIKKDCSEKNIMMLTPKTIDSIPRRLISEQFSNEFKAILSSYIVLNLNNSDPIMPSGYLFVHDKSVILQSGASHGAEKIQDMYQAYQRSIETNINEKPRNCVSTNILPEGPYVAVYKNSSCLIVFYDILK